MTYPPRRRFRTILALALAFAATAGSASAQSYNFSQNNGGFTKAPPFNQWGYSAGQGQWFEIGQLSIDNRLLSPIVTAAGGAATLDLSHTFSLNAYTDFFNALHCYDAGIVTMSVNGGAFNVITPDRGLLYNGVLDINSGNPMYGQHGFCGGTPNPGLMTLSGFDMTFNAGDQVQFGFDATWDQTQNAPSSSWRLGEVDLAGFGTANVAVTPEPASLVLVGTGMIGLCAVGRRRGRQR